MKENLIYIWEMEREIEEIKKKEKYIEGIEYETLMKNLEKASKVIIKLIKENKRLKDKLVESERE